MQVELGQVVFSLVFWIGIGVLLAAAVALRFCTIPIPEAPPGGSAIAPDAAGSRPVLTIRRGRVRLAIWRSGRGGSSAGGHRVRVDRRGPDCGDCMDCVNQALRWIREHEAAS